ncbi:MAG: hypothetical protein KDD58_02395 [Bdellovibrionales bacterium]|nr:hypothetical protein [Bdellovibrionales bacterium]
MFKKCFLILLLSNFLLLGCTTISTPVVNSIDLNSINSININTLVRSEACSTYFLGIGPIGESDSSLITALDKVPLKNVFYIEKTFSNYFLMQFNCTVAYGKRDEKRFKTKSKHKDGKIDFSKEL